MADIQTDFSQVAETNEDLLSMKFCECKHLLSDHFLGRCFALEFNGTVFSACRCNNAKVLSFILKIPVGDLNVTNSKDCE